MSESDMQKMFRAVAEQAQQQATEKMREDIIKVQAALYDKAASYTNLILAAGYAGFFATWTNVKADLTKFESAASALCIAVSLMVFITWEVVVMIASARGIRGMQAALDGPPKETQKRLADAKLIGQKRAVRIRRWWIYVLIATILPGVAGAGILLAALVRRILESI